MEHSAPLWMDPEFWVAVGTILLLALAARPLGKMLGVMLDDRAKIIQTQLHEAESALAAAQAKLNELSQAQAQAASAAGQIMRQAELDAESLRARSAQELEHALIAREKHAMDKIMQAERAAVQEIREMAVTLATTLSRRILQEKMTEQQMDAVLTETLQGLLQRRLN